MDSHHELTMAQSEAGRRLGDNNDTAPWWVKEIRPYGLTGLLIAAACWFVFDRTGKLDEQIKAKDAVITTVVSDTAKSNWQLSDSLTKLTEELKKKP